MKNEIVKYKILLTSYAGGWFKECLKDLNMECLVLKLSGLSSQAWKEEAMSIFRGQYVPHTCKHNILLTLNSSARDQ